MNKRIGQKQISEIHCLVTSIKHTILCSFCVHRETEIFAPVWTHPETILKTKAATLFSQTSRWHRLSPWFTVILEQASGTHPLGCTADGRVTVLGALQVGVHILFKLRLEVFCTLADQIVAFNFKVVQTVFEASNFFHRCLEKEIEFS